MKPLRSFETRRQLTQRHSVAFQQHLDPCRYVLLLSHALSVLRPEAITQCYVLRAPSFRHELMMKLATHPRCSIDYEDYCLLDMYRHYGWTCCPNLQGRKVVTAHQTVISKSKTSLGPNLRVIYSHITTPKDVGASNTQAFLTSSALDETERSASRPDMYTFFIYYSKCIHD
jgi:hypothetical protein